MQSYLNQINHISLTSFQPNLSSSLPTEIHKPGTADGWHGAIHPDGPFPPENDRYHLYIGLFCPFAHRVNIIRHLYGLQDILPISVVKPYPKGDEKGWPGWQFLSSSSSGQEKTSENGYPGATVDRVFGAKYLHEIYFKADPEYKGRYSVPCLWDRKSGTIVGNESAEIMRWLPRAFDSILPTDARKVRELDLYPVHLREMIDTIGVWMQKDLNAGVYKAGFAPDQATYDKNVIPVFGALNALEKVIQRNGGPYILGKEMTELDIRAYVTIVRFDTVYVQHFKCNLGTIRHDYPQVNNWLKNLYWNHPAFKETTTFRHIKENYTKSHHDINPKAITPMGPFPDVEKVFQPDFSKVPVGGVDMPNVLEHERELLRQK